MITNDVQQDFVRGDVAKITTYSTNTAQKFLNRHFLSRGDKRNLGNIHSACVSRIFPNTHFSFDKNCSL